ncbi:MAG: molecular chaperone DnaJ [Elusimicrobiota bacterium]|nr:molecular chaperone DnaJ [Elusimicrobiota bacterium]
MDDNHNGWEIIETADFKSAKKEIEKLREELSELVSARDFLIYQECKQIETAYLLSCGGLEYKIYEISCAILRLKRKIELIQAQKNRQEEVNFLKIEKILEEEFKKYQEKLDERLGAINDALEFNKGEFLSQEDTAELKKLYHSIVKSLHPDLNPDVSPEKIKLFHNAVDAYKNGNLNSIRIIYAMTSQSIVPDMKSNGMPYFVSQKEHLESLIKSVKNSIEEIKLKYPYTMKEFVDDSQKMEARKIKFEKEIQESSEILNAYKKKTEEMLGGGDE